MSIRIDCPSCDASNTVDDEKRGSKVRCRKCKEPFMVPAGKKKRDDDDDDDQDSVQEGRKVKSKAAARIQADDDDDDKPTPKKKKDEGGMGMILVLGGVAVAFLFLLIGAAGIGGYFWYRSKQADAERLIADAGDKKDDQKGDNKGDKKDKVDAKTKIDVVVGEKKAPEQKKDPIDRGKEKDPVPDVKNKPDTETKSPKLDPLPRELQRVRQATVHVRAIRPDGKSLEGSGFFVESGLVVTNAHVLGMLEPNSPEPTRIDVTMNGGEPNQLTVPALATVDRANDLAVLRILGVATPVPLSFEDSNKLSLNQKVQIAGFPFGNETRKDPSFADTAISNLKKTGANALEEIQFNGGMSPGHSGGPVVTRAGKVVGVALGAVKDTNIHLAIPPETVLRFLAGRLGDMTFDQPREGLKKTVISATVQLMDPKQRIRAVRFESWTGNATPAPSYSYTEPNPMPGDGPRLVGPTISKTATSARGNIVVPTAVPSGQVVWVQAIATLDDKSKQWSAAAILPIPKTEYDKKPINLTANFQNPKERTVDLKYTFQGDDKPMVLTTHILESMTPQTDGAIMRTGFGTFLFSGAAKDDRFRVASKVTRTIPTTYTLDSAGKVKARDYRKIAPDVSKEIRDAAIEHLVQIGQAHELAMMPFPNRQVQPGENWNAPVSIVVMNKNSKFGSINFLMNCTYEGLLTKGDKQEAVVTVNAKLRSADPDFRFFDSDLAGAVGVDMSGGFVSSGKLKLTALADAGKPGLFSLEVELTRTAGNSRNLQLPQEPKTTDPPKDPKVAKKPLLDQKLVLGASDPVDASLSNPKQKALAHYKLFQIPMEAGKTYHIDVRPGAAFDSVIRIQAPNNAVLGQEKHRTNFTAPASAVYRVNIIAANHRTGQFHLVITEK
ncbi:MAG: trypsin-like peptidase domain-containing protein [Planctomycetes bacterium]|nr:trypsin-like peptidase domain-containing protein [Planctomycetota bacterium]